ncbi:cold shock protein 1-like [Pollicipes pollicipes]|uniref:cold shock protein 1-like n=1 Tax=Pollicipes pollicipes TaxID=41117 RepID=UPI00188564D1|nr:cold shock protein 1-like [Pollicipes pollicipes]
MVKFSGPLREKLFRKAATRGDALTLAEVRAVARAHKDAGDLAEQMAGGGTSPADSGARAEEALPMQALRQRPASGRQPPPGQCYRCGEAGHWRRDCQVGQRGPRLSDRDRQRSGPAGPRGPQAARQDSSGRSSGDRRLAGRGTTASDNEPPIRRCFKCGDPGHLKRNCPLRGQVASVEEDVVLTVAPAQLRQRDRLPLVTVSVSGKLLPMLVILDHRYRS